MGNTVECKIRKLMHVPWGNDSRELTMVHLSNRFSHYKNEG